MDKENFTMITEFFLFGLTDRTEFKVFLFMLFLVIYVISLEGNIGMLVLIQISPKLYSPMYFFLHCLSCLDACYCSVIAPQMLVNFFEEKGTISQPACILQYCVFALLISTEGFLLSAMAYDRYIAIVNPWLYIVVMTKRVCATLIIGSFIGGTINSLTHTLGLVSLSFYGSNISHFFCDLPQLLKLSCTNTSRNELLLPIFSGVIASIIFLIIITSYIFIVIDILRICLVAGRHKAFPTCASHLTTVTLLYGSISFSYVQPSSHYFLEQEKIISVFYTMVIRMLNPLIYSLRNNEVKDAMKRAIELKPSFC